MAVFLKVDILRFASMNAGVIMAVSYFGPTVARLAKIDFKSFVLLSSQV
jgi:hypothetical protein